MPEDSSEPPADQRGCDDAPEHRAPATGPSAPEGTIPGPGIDRRRLDAVFGEVLPDTTSDERDGRGNRGGPDSWYLENRPPHHDR